MKKRIDEYAYEIKSKKKVRWSEENGEEAADEDGEWSRGKRSEEKNRRMRKKSGGNGKKGGIKRKMQERKKYGRER